MSPRNQLVRALPLIIGGFLIVALIRRFHGHHTWTTSIVFALAWDVLMFLGCCIGIRIGKKSRQQQHQ